jgi:hypothetical protein
MRHRGWVDVAALLLMGVAAWLIRASWTDDRIRGLRDLGPGVTGELNSLLWLTVAASAALAAASAAMLATARAPRIARRSPPAAAVLVLVAAAATLYDPVRVLTRGETWTYGPERTSDRLLVLLPSVTEVACLGALALGIAVPLLRRGRSGPAASGAAVVWAVFVAVNLARDSVRRFELGTLMRSDVTRPWLFGATGLVVVAGGLLVTAWCAGPPADRAKVLARCRGGYAAVALLIPPTAALDVWFAVVNGDEAPSDGWLALHGGLLVATAVAAACAALFPAWTPVLAGVVPALGLAVAVVDHLPGGESLYVQVVGPSPVIVAAVLPVLLAAVVAYAGLRITRLPVPSVSPPR